MEQKQRRTQPGKRNLAPKKTATLSVGSCTLSAGDFIHVHERTYIILGMD